VALLCKKIKIIKEVVVQAIELFLQHKNQIPVERLIDLEQDLTIKVYSHCLYFILNELFCAVKTTNISVNLANMLTYFANVR
jgi:hypothetical protein